MSTRGLARSDQTRADLPASVLFTANYRSSPQSQVTIDLSKMDSFDGHMAAPLKIVLRCDFCADFSDLVLIQFSRKEGLHIMTDDADYSSSGLSALVRGVDRPRKRRGHQGRRCARSGKARWSAGVSQPCLSCCTSRRGACAGIWRRVWQTARGDVQAHRARLAKAQASLVETKQRKLAGELVEAAEVEAEWSGVLRTVRAGMLAVSSRCAQRLPHLTPHDIAEIDAEVREALTAVAQEEAQCSGGDGEKQNGK
jgi:hypothetical protein